ncbi:MAG: 6-carboxytetrahydropterin synthase [Chloroflexota bacterium]
MYQSTKILELGSCAFRQPNAAYVKQILGDGSIGGSRKCSLLHGYQLMAKFWFSADALDECNWIIDFGNLKELKTILQNQFDHTVVLCENDPIIPLMKEIASMGGCNLRIMAGVGIEKTAEWCYHAAQEVVTKQSNGRCWVSKVEVWEHELNSAIYIPPFGDPLKYFPTHE